jgi:tetratricopeptide (TPR) repeat protein
MSYLATVAIAVGEYERASSALRLALEIHEKASEKHNASWDRYKRGQIASCRGEYTQARIEFEECHKVFEQMNSNVGQAWCRYELGKIALDNEELADATAHFEHSLSMFRILGRPNAWANLHLGITAIYEGRFRSARKLLQKSLTTFRETAAKNGIAHSLWELARLARIQADYDAAQTFLCESLELTKQMDSKRFAASVLQQKAYLAHAQQQYESSVRLFGRADALRDEMGSPLPLCDRAEYNNAIEKSRAALGEDPFSKLWEEGRLAAFDQLDSTSG